MTEPKWMATGRSLIGTKEVPGAKSNPKIIEWAKKVTARFKGVLGMNYTDDATPWCGLWMAYVMSENNIKPASIAVRASSWATWGTKLEKGCPGAILVFTRTGGGHVGLYVSEDDNYYHVLGGNQSDAVSITKIAKSRCSAIRWPAGVAEKPGFRVLANVAGGVSRNEA